MSASSASKSTILPRPDEDGKIILQPSKSIPSDNSDSNPSSSTLRLSPFDLSSFGGSVPFVWYYDVELDRAKLLHSLLKVFEHYPCFCGRYSAPAEAEGKKAYPMSLDLNNKGVVVYCEENGINGGDEGGSEKGKGFLPMASPICRTETTNASFCEEGRPLFFPKSDHEKFVPPKSGMDPDIGSPDQPLLAIKISPYAIDKNKGIGTAIGILVQHGIADTDTMIVFMKNWARFYRGEEGLEIEVSHERRAEEWKDEKDIERSANSASAASTSFEKPCNLKMQSVPPSELMEKMVPFWQVMPKIMGSTACVVPLSPEVLGKWKQQAMDEIADHGGSGSSSFVSGDDVLTARVWRAMAKMRCEQLSLPLSATTVLCRVSNFRKRTKPPLSEGYCGNAIAGVWNEETVQDLQGMSDAEIAKLLRQSLDFHTPENITQWARWLSQEQAKGNKTVGESKDGGNALRLIVSSWNFDWEGARFEKEVAPVAFDHGALSPIIAVFTPRAGGVKLGGMNVWVSGVESVLGGFVEELMKHNGSGAPQPEGSY